MKNLFHTIAIAALSLSFNSWVQADILAEYKFPGTSLTSNDASTTWETSDISAGAGVPMTVSGTEGNPAPGIEITFNDFNYANLGISLANDAYYSFTVTPDASTQLDFTNLSFDMYKSSGAGATISVTVFSSVDGFAETGDAIGSGTLVGASESAAFFSRSVALSSLPTVTTATEFRLYLDDGGATNNGNDFRLDNIVLNGAGAVIPEPASIALMIQFGLLLLIARRRRA